MLNAYSKFHYYDKSITDAFCKHATSKAREFNSQNIAMLLNALAYYNHFDRELVEAMCAVAHSSAAQFKSQDVCNTIHALTVFGYFDEALFAKLIETVAVCTRNDFDSLVFEQKSQIHFVSMSLTLKFGRSVLDRIGITQEIQDCCVTSHRKQMANDMSSKFHMDVSRILSQIGVVHENEHVANGMSCDMIVRTADGSLEIAPAEPPATGRTTPVDRPGKSGDIIVEIDGPTHYLRGREGTDDINGGRTRELNGLHLYKESLLRAFGYKVVHVPYYDWDGVLNEEEKKGYMRAKLEAAGAPFQDAPLL